MNFSLFNKPCYNNFPNVLKSMTVFYLIGTICSSRIVKKMYLLCIIYSRAYKIHDN